MKWYANSHDIHLSVRSVMSCLRQIISYQFFCYEMTVMLLVVTSRLEVC